MQEVVQLLGMGKAAMKQKDEVLPLNFTVSVAVDHGRSPQVLR